MVGIADIDRCRFTRNSLYVSPSMAKHNIIAQHHFSLAELIGDTFPLENYSYGTVLWLEYFNVFRIHFHVHSKNFLVFVSVMPLGQRNRLLKIEADYLRFLTFADFGKLKGLIFFRSKRQSLQNPEIYLSLSHLHMCRCHGYLQFLVLGNSKHKCYRYAITSTWNTIFLPRKQWNTSQNIS